MFCIITMRSLSALFAILHPLDIQLAFQTCLIVVIIPTIGESQQAAFRHIHEAIIISIMLRRINTYMAHQSSTEHRAYIGFCKYIEFGAISFAKKSVDQKLVFVK